MHRRHFLRNTGIITGASLFLQNNAFASFLNPFEYKVTMLRRNVGIFTERGGTIGFLISKDGAVVIDSQFADTAPHVIDEINKQSTSPIGLLLNTHHSVLFLRYILQVNSTVLVSHYLLGYPLEGDVTGGMIAMMVGIE